MRNAKGTFYITLRNRLSMVNAKCTMTLRGMTRPGILVEEAESPTAELPLDVFVLRWTKMAADTELPSIFGNRPAKFITLQRAHKPMPVWIADGHLNRWTMNCCSSYALHRR